MGGLEGEREREGEIDGLMGRRTVRARVWWYFERKLESRLKNGVSDAVAVGENWMRNFFLFRFTCVATSGAMIFEVSSFFLERSSTPVEKGERKRGILIARMDFHGPFKRLLSEYTVLFFASSIVE